MRFRDLKTVAELTDLYRFKNPECCRDFLRRHRVPHQTRGRVLLVDTRDFDAVCEELKARAHGKASVPPGRRAEAEGSHRLM